MSLLSTGELPVKIAVPKPENKHRTATPNSRKNKALVDTGEGQPESLNSSTFLSD